MSFLRPILLGAVLLGSPIALSADPSVGEALQVMQELDRLGAQPLWPGFDARSYPVAIYTGEQTVLFRHGSPPEGFVESEAHPGIWIYPGRHPLMRSNSKARIGDLTTATLLLTISPGRPAREEASIVVHESFHIFQDERHPDWRANEAHRFTYPVNDAENYRLTIEEDHALGRALESPDVAVAARWAALAMDLRAKRVENLAEEHRTFELGLEMMEGTAFYVAHLAVGQADSTETLLEILPPEKFRWRPYATGAAIAALLDRFAPGWKARIEASPELTLEQLLRDYLSGSRAEPARFSPEELAGFREQATAAVRQLQAERAEHRARFESPSGPKVAVLVPAGTDGFTPEQFDVVNVLNLGDGEVLHGHRLTLTHARGRVQMTNPGFVRREFVGLNALTRVENGHPLLGAVQRVSFVGFGDEPRIETDEGTIRVIAEGFELELRGATVERSGSSIRVTVGGPGPGTSGR